MTCITTIPSTSNTLKNFSLNKKFHSSCIQREFNDKKYMVINIFSAYAGTLLEYINHPALLQEWKLNHDDAYYKRNIDANIYKPSGKKSSL